jgi:hypothetical protein
LNNKIHPLETDTFTLNTPIPQASSDGLYSELESLTRLMEAVSTQMKDEYGETNYAKWEQLYYPAASGCYAYEPTVKIGEKIDSKFKKHNWFLPTLGELMRMFYYISSNKTMGDNIFAKAINKGLMSSYFTGNGNAYSSTERHASNAWAIWGTIGQIYDINKWNTAECVRPVCAF